MEIVKNNFPEVIVIKNEHNVGFGKANNQGADAAKGDFLFFINSDIILKGNPFQEMLDFYKSHSLIGLLGAQLVNNDGSIQPSHYKFPGLFKRLLEICGLKRFLFSLYRSKIQGEEKFYSVDSIKGAFFLVSKEKFFKMGGFDEYFFMYVEDIDLSFTFRKNNYKNYLYNTNLIIHLGWNIVSLENAFLLINSNKGLIYFYQKNYPSIIYFGFITMNMLYFSVLSLFISKKNNSHKVVEDIKSLYKSGLLNFFNKESKT